MDRSQAALATLALMLAVAPVRAQQPIEMKVGLAALVNTALPLHLAGAGGFYALQAAIVACHAQARTASDTDWPRIAEIYAELAAIVRSPIIELNRAVAVGMAEGPEAGLSIVDGLMLEPTLRSYHLLPSVRGDLLHRLGRYEEARVAFEAAAATSSYPVPT